MDLPHSCSSECHFKYGEREDGCHIFADLDLKTNFATCQVLEESRLYSSLLETNPCKY